MKTVARFALTLVLAAPAPAQGLDDARDALRDSLQRMPFGQGLARNDALAFGEDLFGWTLGASLSF